ncbi:PREDICTED: uncharacterized protein LOC107072264 [Polistes dominula]|uniref:Uncharacterized protein LOC107072264 n=1 Tax=Polistes dominula TaxID=743375 RepID=A0ABM1J4Z1_POLDO|nr:PREDICTED: uncharacterized protein LOC107072264 [Polistes dominula]
MLHDFQQKQGPWYKIAIFNVHAPTEDKKDEVKDGFYKELERVVDQLPKNYMKIVVGDFNAKIGNEEFFIQTIGPESLHEERPENDQETKNFEVLTAAAMILEKKWEFDQPVRQLNIDFQKAYDSVKREKMLEILIRQGIPRKLVNLAQLCLKETRDKVRIVLEFAVKKLQKSKDGLQLKGTTQLLTYTDDIALLGDNEEA